MMENILVCQNAQKTAKNCLKIDLNIMTSCPKICGQKWKNVDNNCPKNSQKLVKK